MEQFILAWPPSGMTIPMGGFCSGSSPLHCVLVESLASEVNIFIYLRRSHLGLH